MAHRWISPERAQAYALSGLSTVISFIEGRCPSLMLFAPSGLILAILTEGEWRHKTEKGTALTIPFTVFIWLSLY
jgi:hypothetical protein